MGRAVRWRRRSLGWSAARVPRTVPERRARATRDHRRELRRGLRELEVSLVVLGIGGGLGRFAYPLDALEVIASSPHRLGGGQRPRHVLRVVRLRLGDLGKCELVFGGHERRIVGEWGDYGKSSRFTVAVASAAMEACRRALPASPPAVSNARASAADQTSFRWGSRGIQPFRALAAPDRAES